MISHIKKVAILAVLTACACHDSRPPSVVVDTLPGGVVAVRNYAPSAWRDSTAWHFEEVARIEPQDSGSEGLVNPGAMAAMDSAGRAYIVDEPPVFIKVFDSTGHFVRTIGRSGDGPGEYRRPRIAIHDGELFVADSRLQRVSVFDTSGALIRSFHAESNAGGPGTFMMDDSSRIWLRIFQPDRPDVAVTVVRFDTMGMLLDTLRFRQLHDPAVWVLDQKGGRATYGIPGGPRELAALTPSGTMLRGWSGAYALVMQSAKGDSLRVINRDWTPIKVPEAERVERFDRFKDLVSRNLSPELVNRTLHLYDMPTERPPMRDIDVDPTGRIWVHTASADTSASLYDVFDPVGIWQGTVRAPWARSAEVVWRGVDRVLVREPDADGLAAFVVYRVVES